MNTIQFEDFAVTADAARAEAGPNSKSTACVITYDGPVTDGHAGYDARDTRP